MPVHYQLQTLKSYCYDHHEELFYFKSYRMEELFSILSFVFHLFFLVDTLFTYASDIIYYKHSE